VAAVTALVNISDHALVRWLERIRGEDFSAVRAEIDATPGLRQAVEKGAMQFLGGGLLFVLKRGTVVTIVDKGE
jgi:hypothetical protein